MKKKKFLCYEAIIGDPHQGGSKMRKRIYYECLDQSDAFVILGNCDQNLWRNLIRLFFCNLAKGTRHEPIEMTSPTNGA